MLQSSLPLYEYVYEHVCVAVAPFLHARFADLRSARSRVINIGADRETTLNIAKELLPNLEDVSYLLV